MQRFDFKTSIIAINHISCYDFKSAFNLRTISNLKELLNSDFVVAVIIIILIQVMKDFRSLTVISVEYYFKVNPACFKCFKMINSWIFF